MLGRVHPEWTGEAVSIQGNRCYQSACGGGAYRKLEFDPEWPLKTLAFTCVTELQGSHLQKIISRSLYGRGQLLQPFRSTTPRLETGLLQRLGCTDQPDLGPLHRLSAPFTAGQYIDVLDHVLLPFLLDGPFADGCFVLQHDRSPVHQATAVKIYLEERCINSLQWPPRGADLN
ncbi:hypothetical protein HPB47_018049 [Ixodes persulcatus]|uniref:Uncharacterized protein n=1 Tax=Ixodes persulcatus TaxID=34615 RepID=A0AC60QLP7_IXOPE|nr:hypothetical protein HPB47_018049 [Ixodes persulcatus]